MQTRAKPLVDLKVEDVDDYVGFAVEEHDVPTDEHVSAIGRRWRQTMLQLFGAGVQTLLQTRRQCAADDQLLFQTGRKPISLSESRREMSFVLGVPSADLLLVVLVVVVVAILVADLFVMFIVALAMAVAVIVILG